MATERRAAGVVLSRTRGSAKDADVVGLSRADRFAPKDRTAWQLSPSVARHWRTVYGHDVAMPLFSDVGRALRGAIAAYAECGTPAAFVVPEWHSASWAPLLKRFRLDHSYRAGLSLLAHPDHPDRVVASRHPLAVIRLPAPGEMPLSASQRRNAGRCVDW